MTKALRIVKKAPVAELVSYKQTNEKGSDIKGIIKFNGKEYDFLCFPSTLKGTSLTDLLKKLYLEGARVLVNSTEFNYFSPSNIKKSSGLTYRN